MHITTAVLFHHCLEEILLINLFLTPRQDSLIQENGFTDSPVIYCLETPE